MNAGRDYAKAKAHAQANANLDGHQRRLHMYNGVWWISEWLDGRTYPSDHERIDPTPDCGQYRVPCLGCGGPVPHNQGSDYCATCIEKDTR